MLRAGGTIEDYAYLDPTNCYIEVLNDNSVNSFNTKTKSESKSLLEAVHRVEKEESKLYMAWAGRWSTDLFQVTDTKTLADKLLHYIYNI